MKEEEEGGDDDKALSDIEVDDGQIIKELLSEKERQLKKNLWKSQNHVWLAEQAEKKRERKEIRKEAKAKQPRSKLKETVDEEESYGSETGLA